MNTRLNKDLTDFLNTYFNFIINADKSNDGYLVLDGVINVIDTNGDFWNDYEVRIVIPELGYPHVVPEVYESSTKIERDDDFHISKKGKCCLDIHHKLMLEKRRGITLISFYKKYVYPFFANHQYKIKTESYAGEEYKHDADGVVQFYKEEFNLTDCELIVKYINCSLGVFKTERNKQCPICGGPKYKKCCRITVEKLKPFGKEILKLDLEIFKAKLARISS
ncbi:hypothetical protein [Gelidibacter japonicus]|uniref:hypothetical protein n=1 Tax=Gelidibacter japonicus TaxID=1962232 RepID=UPI003A8F1F9F